MTSYKYTYHNWASGDINIDDIMEALEANELARKELWRIYKRIEVAFVYLAIVKFEERKDAFISYLTQSLAKLELLKMQISIVEREIQEFKENYLQEYYDAIIGIDRRFSLTYKETVDFIYNPFDVDIEGTDVGVLVKLKFLDWLQWLIDDSDKKLEPKFESSFELFNKWIERKYIKDEVEVTMIKHYSLLSNKLNISQSTGAKLYLKKIRKDLGDELSESDHYRIKLLEQKQKRTKRLSYEWLINPDTELPKLYQLLINKKLIHPITTEEQFKAVFTEQSLEEIEAVKWIGDKSLLAYFLDRIHNKSKIPLNTNVWSLAEKCFVDGKELAKSRNNYERINKNKKPKDFKVVDIIINALA